LDCASVLWEIAESLAGIKEIASANNIAQTIKNDSKRRRALEGIDNIQQGKAGSFADTV
jgi:hypothetical protein